MEANQLFDDMVLIVVVSFFISNCSYPKAFYGESLLEECGTGTASRVAMPGTGGYPTAGRHLVEKWRGR